jgi:hypothetical protein
MTLTKPDFKLDRPNPSPDYITDAEWWLALRLEELEPSTMLGGIYANKAGFHNRGANLPDHGAGNSRTDYSIRDLVNRTGSLWKTKASALDWTFPDAQRGDYTRIGKYGIRLLRACQNAADPRPDMLLFDFYMQVDKDTAVEGWNELYERAVSSDKSHLWHGHYSFLRSRCGDFWAMWALLTVFMGWTVEQWRASLPPPQRPVIIPADQTRKIIMSMIVAKRGVKHGHVARAQALLKGIWGYQLDIDSDFGPATEKAVRAWQAKVKRPVTGIVDADDWSVMFTGGVAAITVPTPPTPPKS